MHEESPEGGRFKKEVVIDGQSYLLLIRDEGGPPEMQFAHWCDAVVFVFSVENEESFLMAHQFYLKMLNYRSMHDLPVILVGTQDYVTETCPRVIDDGRARSLAHELKKCAYYETCATYGLNVERVFLDGNLRFFSYFNYLAQAKDIVLILNHVFCKKKSVSASIEHASSIVELDFGVGECIESEAEHTATAEPTDHVEHSSSSRIAHERRRQ